MSTKRNDGNSAPAADGSPTLGAAPPPEIYAPRLRLRRHVSIVLLTLLSVVLLWISFSPFDCWYVGYVALVPWAMSITPSRHRRSPVLIGWMGGLVFWAGAIYWLAPITLAGDAPSVLYLSVFWLVATLVVRAAMRRRMPMWIVLPVVWVALEYARANLIDFPWFTLALTQYRQTRLIQIADITGQYGVSFFVAMVNGAILDLMISPLFFKGRDGRPVFNRRMVLGTAGALLVLAGLLGYGSWRLAQPATAPGPVVGIVQHAFPISLNKPNTPPGKVFADHLRTSYQFEQASCDVVIWPETMLPPGMNAEYVKTLERLGSPRLRHYREYGRQIARLSKRLGCPILAGGTTYYPKPDAKSARDVDRMRNSALWFDGSPTPTAQYDKMHLVPFSEYVPFRESWPWLHKVLRGFVPSVMPQLEPGTNPRAFELRRGDKTWHIVSPICFEGTIPNVCRRLVYRDGRKIDNLIMANLSNDGWFVVQRWADPVDGRIVDVDIEAEQVVMELDPAEEVRPDMTLLVHRGAGFVARVRVLQIGPGGSVRAGIIERGGVPEPGDEICRTVRSYRTTEQSQHLAHYFFRAVENRVPVVRAVNTGISAGIDSCGRLIREVRHEGRRTMISGTLLLREVLVDRRVTLYSQFGDVFALAVCAAAAGLLIVLARVRPAGDEERTP